VIVAEGEKAADAAAKLFPDMVAVTSMGGAKSAGKTDWAALADRRVVVATDNDEAGLQYGREVRKLALKAGAREVLHLAPDRLGRWIWRDGQRVPREGELPQGWDLADALDEGWSAETVGQQVSEPDFFEPFEASTAMPADAVEADDGPFRLTDDGVYLRSQKGGGETWEWITSPLEVVAETRDAEGDNWGRLLRITDRDGRTKEWAMPMAMLAGDGTAMRERLLSMGLVIAPGPRAKDALTRYIATAQPTEKARCVNRIGWHGFLFVLPDTTIGSEGAERVILQASGQMDHAFRRRGTLDSWKEKVARHAIGNSRLIFSLSAAFAASLLEPLGLESGGFHLRGPSSIGKSTSLWVAGSVWGGGGVTGYIRQWRVTDNGLEAVAVNHCDTLLCLDELSQIDPKAAGAAAYMLANGSGKSRAGRSGEGRPSAQWRTLFLSNGEIGIADKIAEDGKGRHVAAGQQVRVVDIPADAGAGLGLFENLHGFATADELARHLKAAASQCYGTAGPAFVARVAAERDEVIFTVRAAMQTFVDQHCPHGADGQVQRVARRFALVAAAGELAAAFGILTWHCGEATEGVAVCFNAWLHERGGVGAAEVKEVISRVRHYIQLHGMSRFAPIGRGNSGIGVEGADRVIHNRAGYRRMENSGGERWEYLLLPEVFKKEVCAGLDYRFVIKVLVQSGYLIPDKSGKPQSTHRVPEGGTVRLLRISGRIMEGEDDA